MIKFFIHTFGCQMNESDSERLAGILSAAGGVPAERVEDADVVVVNTCAVREKSEEKLFSYLGRLAQLKRGKPLRVGVVGCVAQLRGVELLGPRFGADFVLGPDNYAEIPRLLASAARERFVSTDWSTAWRETPPGFLRRAGGASAYVTVMEGCNNFCSYCVVPFTRGREKYRPLASILEEVRGLALRGYKEVQLLGQNVNAYRDGETGAGLVELLRRASEIDGISWLRFLTSHPRRFPAEIGGLMRERTNVCRQIHLPLQSGSSKVLRKMRRGYTRETYLDLAARLRALVPDLALSTDIIVGFPGESERDFEETLAALRAVRFTNIFSFCYSPRPLTRAAKLADDVPGPEKKRRLAAVQALQKELQLEINAGAVDRVQRVLCQGPGKKTPELMTGRNEANQVVNFLSKGAGSGAFVPVRITGFGPYSLRGEEAAP